jgi:hypothetical protein
MVDDPRRLAAIARANRDSAVDLATRAGRGRTLDLLRRAEADLNARLASIPAGASTSAQVQMMAVRAQIRAVVKDLTRGLGNTVLEQGDQAADMATGDLLDYVKRGNRAFLGVGGGVLPIQDVAVLDRVRQGVRSSLLHRLSRAGESAPGDDPLETANVEAKGGILQRYGASAIEAIEQQLQLGILTNQSWAEMRANVIAQSPFLKGAPASWAERLVRTEIMGASNRASWETIRAVDDELGDVVKILSATFDNRTGWDSFQVHGQIRKPDQPFEWDGKMYQHPPNRPNDREVVVIHRIAWPLPETLGWRSDGEVISRWRLQGRKGSPPGRPRMTTVPLDSFGHDS